MGASHLADMDLFRQLSLASRSDAGSYIRSARTILTGLTARDGLFDGIALDRRAGGYMRNLVFGDSHVSVWAILWDAGAETSIHDHHCSCCFAVLSGSIEEVRYRAVEETTLVAVSGETTRHPGYVGCMLPTGPNIHQMVNRGRCEAVTLHVYGFDARMRASSIATEYVRPALAATEPHGGAAPILLMHSV